MKKNMHLLFAALALFVAISVQAQDKQLFIMHSSDTHSRIDPVEDKPHIRNAGMGGVTRRAAVLKTFREEHPEGLIFDCGDFSQGMPYYNLYKGELEVKAMNLMGYDAVTIGNHEFDFGMDNMARIYSMAKFPVVCSNYDFTGTVLENIVKPYVIIVRSGVKIGIFGLSPRLSGLVQNTKCEGVVFKDPATVADEMAQMLKQEKECDVVICLSHLGISKNAAPNSIYDNAIIPKTHGIDFVLGGHTHTFLEKAEQVEDADGKLVPIMHIGNNGVYMSNIVIDLNKQK